MSTATITARPHVDRSTIYYSSNGAHGCPAYLWSRQQQGWEECPHHFVRRVGSRAAAPNPVARPY